MSEQIFLFTVDSCPFSSCGKAHRYRIHVRTMPTFGTAKAAPASSQQRTYHADLLVVCPTTMEDYQVTLKVPFAQGQKVVSVQAKPDTP